MVPAIRARAASISRSVTRVTGDGRFVIRLLCASLSPPPGVCGAQGLPKVGSSSSTESSAMSRSARIWQRSLLALCGLATAAPV